MRFQASCHRQGSLGGRSHEKRRRSTGQPDSTRPRCAVTTYYPIVLETETSGAVSAYIPGLPVYAAADTLSKAERAIRAVLAMYLEAHPGARSHARVRVARLSDRRKIDIVGVGALLGGGRSASRECPDCPRPRAGGCCRPGSLAARWSRCRSARGC